MDTTLVAISNLVEQQFPEFYKQEGPNFIAFLEAYYEWMESEGEALYQTRTLRNSIDIDKTAEDFLEFYRETYMRDLPIELLGNQRLFQKHILEMYRGKGSLAGLKLLFRLLYNEDVDLYIPSRDIFKASDGIWVEPKYFEVTYADSLSNFPGKTIRGFSSGARAVVEKVERRFVNGNLINIMEISNISGKFLESEAVVYQGLEVFNAPHIIGSVNELTVTGSHPGNQIGDIFVDADPSKLAPVKAVATATRGALGYIDFKLIDGGTHYSMDAVISITAGSNTSGSGADFIIGSLKDVYIRDVYLDMLSDYGGVALNDTAYGFPGDPTANSSSLISETFQKVQKTFGTIASIVTTNPGSNYDGTVSVSIVDPYTSALGIGGNNAVVTGTAVYGEGLVTELKVIDSGYSYYLGDPIEMMNISDNSKRVFAVPVLGGVGSKEGYYDDTKGFASEDKYLFDGFYYQNFSYVIKSSKALEQYLDVLKKVYHPVGNQVFSNVRLIDDLVLDISEESSVIEQRSVLGDGYLHTNIILDNNVGVLENDDQL